MRLPRSFALLIVTTAVALGACGDDDADSASPPGGDGGEDIPAEASSDTVDTVDIEDFTYVPADVTVAAGAEITVANADTAAHTLTARNGEFNTDTVDGEAEGTFTAPGEPGSYDFYCSFHPFMEGTLVVE